MSQEDFIVDELAAGHHVDELVARLVSGGPALRPSGALQEPNGVAAGTQVGALLSRLTGETVDESVVLFPPLYSEFGKEPDSGQGHLHQYRPPLSGHRGITVGDGSLIGHGSTLTTLDHGIDPDRRGDMIPEPVVLGQKVWLGAGVTVVPGVRISDGAIVGAVRS